MSDKKIEQVQPGSASVSYLYPPDHWKALRRFVKGDEVDPKGLFRLADDRWEAWKYSERGRLSNATDYRYNFGQLRSFLKPYIKLYCYNDLMGRGGRLPRGPATLPYSMKRAECFIIDRGIKSLEALAVPGVFEELWAAQLFLPPDGGNWSGLLPPSAVMIQMGTKVFWQEMSAQYGVPRMMPSVARYKKRIPADIGADQSKLIPDQVIRQLVNKLGLHRDRIVKLNPFHHLRLCVLLLMICLGRRAEEVLGARRGTGPDGPFKRYPCRRHDAEGPIDGLWFQFHPNKGGSSDLVYVSPEWEDLALYCVRELIRHSDQVRDFAAPEERDLLILTSAWNWTGGRHAGTAMVPADDHDFTRCGGERGGRMRRRGPEAQGRATGLSYYTFCDWLIDRNTGSGKCEPSIFEKWNITADGSSSGRTYRLKTGQARHTRQSELARYNQVPLHARQRDLNHSDPGMQMYYQHVLNEENAELQAAVSKSPLPGHDLEWLKDLIGAGISGEPSDHSQYRQGVVQLSTPRWRRLIESNRLYFDSNAVDKGMCDAPQGPAACDLYRPVKKAPVAGDGSKLNEDHAGMPSNGETTVREGKLGAEQQVNSAIKQESHISGATTKVEGLGAGGVVLPDSATLVERLRRRAEQLQEEKL